MVSMILNENLENARVSELKRKRKKGVRFELDHIIKTACLSYDIRSSWWQKMDYREFSSNSKEIVNEDKDQGDFLIDVYKGKIDERVKKWCYSYSKRGLEKISSKKYKTVQVHYKQTCIMSVLEAQERWRNNSVDSICIDQSEYLRIVSEKNTFQAKRFAFVMAALDAEAVSRKTITITEMNDKDDTFALNYNSRLIGQELYTYNLY